MAWRTKEYGRGWASVPLPNGHELRLTGHGPTGSREYRMTAHDATGEPLATEVYSTGGAALYAAEGVIKAHWTPALADRHFNRLRDQVSRGALAPNEKG